MRLKATIPGLLAAGVLLVASASTPGCGSAGGGLGGQTVLDQTPIEQVGKMLRVYQKGLKPPTKGAKNLPVYKPGPVPPPRTVEEIRPMARGFPLAFNAIRDRDVLLYWNTDLADDDAATILAYPKDAPEKGGDILMRDGTIRTMSAAEFGAAPRPPGATVGESRPGTPKR